MKTNIKFFIVKFRDGKSFAVTARTRTEALKMAKEAYLGHMVSGWEDVTEDRIAQYRDVFTGMVTEIEGEGGEVHV